MFRSALIDKTPDSELNVSAKLRCYTDKTGVPDLGRKIVIYEPKRDKSGTFFLLLQDKNYWNVILNFKESPGLLNLVLFWPTFGPNLPWLIDKPKIKEFLDFTSAL